MTSPKARSIDVLRIAAAAPADPRTVRKFLRGEPILSMAEDRIERAVAELQLGHLRATPAPVAVELKAAS